MKGKCKHKIKIDGNWECLLRRKIIAGLNGCLCNKENCPKLYHKKFWREEQKNKESED